MNKRTTLILAVLLLALLIPTGVAAARTFKFTFDPVVFDGIEGVIEAGSKQTQPNKDDPAEYTVCSYYTAGYGEYLGQFASDEFFSEDASEVETFCVANFENRQ